MAQSFHPAKVLVLGANGKLGRMVRNAWGGAAGAGLHTVPVSRVGIGINWAPGKDTAALPEVDAVVALWGVTPAGGGVLEDNTRLAVVAQEMAVELGARRIIHCSSAAVYSPSKGRIHETGTCDPASPYGRAKLCMERALQVWRQDCGVQLETVILRIGNVVGAESLFAALAAGTKVTLHRFPDGQGPARSYIAPGDLASIIATLLRAPGETLRDVYNIAAPEMTLMADLVRSAGREVIWREAPPGAVQRVYLDTERLRALHPLPERSAHSDWMIEDWRRWGVA